MPVEELERVGLHGKSMQDYDKALAKGSTIHHALGLAVFDGDTDTVQCGSGKAKLHRLRKLFEGCKVLIVDEVSMVGCRMLRDIRSRLCEIMQCGDKPFGGMCVVLMGGFVRLTPVGQTELFGCVKVQDGGQDLNDVFGRELFQKFDEVSLMKQHRATDSQYATSVSAFCEWSASALQTRMEFENTIMKITPEKNFRTLLDKKPQLLAPIKRRFRL